MGEEGQFPLFAPGDQKAFAHRDRIIDLPIAFLESGHQGDRLGVQRKGLVPDGGQLGRQAFHGPYVQEQDGTQRGDEAKQENP